MRKDPLKAVMKKAIKKKQSRKIPQVKQKSKMIKYQMRNRITGEYRDVLLSENEVFVADPINNEFILADVRIWELIEVTEPTGLKALTIQDFIK